MLRMVDASEDRSGPRWTLYDDEDLRARAPLECQDGSEREDKGGAWADLGRSSLAILSLGVPSFALRKSFKVALSRRVVMSTLLSLLLLRLFWVTAWSVDHASASTSVPPLPAYNLPDYIAHNAGPYTPRYRLHDFGNEAHVSADLPRGCSVTQVNMLARHGARYPTSDSLDEINAAYAKVRQAVAANPKLVKHTPLAFMTTWNVTLGHDSLVDFGREQAYGSGKEILAKYPHLTKKGVFIRSTSKDRVLESARWFKQAFYGGKYPIPVESLPLPEVVIPTGSDYNNTLSSNNCAAAEAAPEGDADERWLAVYAPPIAARLGSYLPGLNLSNADVPSLMSTCAFETAYYKDGKVPSPWCKLFTKSEWEANEYYEDLDKYWESSHGSPYGRAQGSGWVNELIARLTGTPVHVSGSVNGTLDSDPKTFPIGTNAPYIFADFSSDNNIAHIIAALDILKDKKALSPTGPPNPNRLFVASKLVPFNTNLVVEKLSCSNRRFARGAEHASHSGATDYVRIVLNDAVVPLRLDPCGRLGVSDGLCRLDDFVKSQEFSLSGGGWDEACTIRS